MFIFAKIKQSLVALHSLRVWPLGISLLGDRNWWQIGCEQTTQTVRHLFLANLKKKIRINKMIYSQEHISMNFTLYMVVLLALFKYFTVFTQIIQFLLFITKRSKSKMLNISPIQRRTDLFDTIMNSNI